MGRGKTDPHPGFGIPSPARYANMADSSSLGLAGKPGLALSRARRKAAELASTKNSLLLRQTRATKQELRRESTSGLGAHALQDRHEREPYQVDGLPRQPLSYIVLMLSTGPATDREHLERRSRQVDRTER